jgi:hypothetical protein
MKQTQINKAYAALQALGVPVINKPDWFVISAEDNGTTLWADADRDFMHPEIVSILSANGLDYGWYDSGTAIIHNA